MSKDPGQSVRQMMAGDHEWVEWARALANVMNTYIACDSENGYREAAIRYVEFQETVLALNLGIEDSTMQAIMLSVGRIPLPGEGQEVKDAGSAT